MLGCGCLLCLSGNVGFGNWVDSCVLLGFECIFVFGVFVWIDDIGFVFEFDGV